VRRLCPACRRSHEPDRAEQSLLENGNEAGRAPPLFTASGCEACAFTGYQGRTGIFELLLIIDDEARRLIHDRASEADLRSTRGAAA